MTIFIGFVIELPPQCSYIARSSSKKKIDDVHTFWFILMLSRIFFICSMFQVVIPMKIKDSHKLLETAKKKIRPTMNTTYKMWIFYVNKYIWYLMKQVLKLHEKFKGTIKWIPSKFKRTYYFAFFAHHIPTSTSFHVWMIKLICIKVIYMPLLQEKLLNNNTIYLAQLNSSATVPHCV